MGWVMSTKPAKPVEPRDPPQQAPSCVSSEELLGRAGVLEILHGGERYRLQRTRSGKLILTK